MRKRSKKRIPQDLKPWVRVKEVSNDLLYIPGKKTTRWVAGGRRDWDTKILNAATAGEITHVLLRSFAAAIGQEGGDYSKNLLNKLNYRLHTGNKMGSLAKYKNYCLLSGRGRTYSRSLYMARHNMRKLVGIGLISGLVK
jgi:ribosomal protein S14